MEDRHIFSCGTCMKKPTLAQMKKRPSLWWYENINKIHIVHPGGFVEVYIESVKFHMEGWYETFLPMEIIRSTNEFLGWL